MKFWSIMFCTSVGTLSYTYAVYPALLGLMKRQVRPTPAVSTLPAISVIIPFHNEERWVAAKLENTLSLDYPADRLQIVGVSDGSRDRTTEILESYAERVDVVSYPERRGKPHALNAGLLRATGEILVFTDANVLVDAGALRVMVRHFQDASVGGVSGNVALQPEGSDEPLGEGLYMRYERWLYARESSLCTMVGADGALFAVRRSLVTPLPLDTVTDDFAIALDVVAARRRVVFEPNAKAVEVVVPDVRAEFRRKVRMIAGGYQALWRRRTLLNPMWQGVVALQLWSHKVLRWLVPMFLATAFAATLAGRGSAILGAALVLQLLFYGLALCGWASHGLRRWLPVYVPYYFCAVNLAAAYGLCRYVSGRQPVTWQKVER